MTDADHTTYFEVQEIYKKDFGKLTGITVSKGCRSEEAEEKVNEAFLRFIKHLEKHNWEKKIEKPFSFLVKIIDRLLIDDHKRDQSRLLDSIDDEENPIDPSDRGASVLIIYDRIDKKEYFRKEILPFTQGFSKYEKRVAWLLKIEGYTAWDVAGYFNLPYEVVKPDCNLINAKLRYWTKKQASAME